MIPLERVRQHPAVLSLLAALLGVLHALAFAPRSAWWLQLAALAAAFGLAQRAATPRRAALAGFAFGFGTYATGVSWVYVSMHVYGQMPAPLAALATAAFSAFLASYAALAFGLTHRLIGRPTARLLLGLPAAWALAEALRGTLLTGFPWLAIGYAQVDGPLAGFAPLGGIHGVTLAAAVVAGALAALVRARLAPVSLGLAIAMGGGLLVAGERLRAVAWTVPHGAPLAVELGQGNIAQDLKFSPEGLARSLRTYLDLVEGPPGAPRADLIVLPESILPVPLPDLPAEVPEALHDRARARGAALIYGAFLDGNGGRYVNSAIAWSPAGGLQRYGKRHLVPFGEFIPWGFRWFVDLMQVPIGDQDRGPPVQPSFRVADQRIAVNICYEDLFGDEIVQAWQAPGGEPTVLLNLSNLGWFGRSWALPQHLQIARMRALETGRPMLRATNTGATAAIGADGRVTARLPLHERGVLRATVQGMSGRTPYLDGGDAPALALAVGLLAAGAVVVRRRRAGERI